MFVKMPKFNYNPKNCDECPLMCEGGHPNCNVVNIAQQPLSGSADATPKCSHDMVYQTDGSKPQCKLCGKVAGEIV